MSVLIADDEPPARQRIRALLDEHAEIRVVGEARSGREAIAAIEKLRPDVVFLDVQMPEGDGFDVVRAVGVERMPITVFVTAYDAYALQAFEVHALDYLLKPYERERFEAVLERLRSQVSKDKEAPVDPKLLAFVRRLHDQPKHLDRLAVPVGPRIRFVDVDDVDYVEAEGNYAAVHAGGKTHLIRKTLSALEEELDPERFLRVHRSLIVNGLRIVEAESLFAGEYVLTLRDGTQLRSGRTYRKRVQEALRLRG